MTKEKREARARVHRHSPECRATERGGKETKKQKKYTRQEAQAEEYRAKLSARPNSAANEQQARAHAPPSPSTKHARIEIEINATQDNVPSTHNPHNNTLMPRRCGGAGSLSYKSYIVLAHPA
jgi:hypothetical protein